MAGIDPNLFCEMESTNTKVGTEVRESNVKVEVPNCQESIFTPTNYQNDSLPPGTSTYQMSSACKQTRTENKMSNGCLKHKHGENGLIKHSSVIVEPIVYSNDNSETEYVQDSDSTSLPIVENLSLIEKSMSEPDKDETDNRVGTVDGPVDCDSSQISLLDCDFQNGIEYVVYESELQMPDIMRLITKDLSEPYSIYTYRYFIHNWPKLCFLTMSSGQCVGAIVCKLDMHKKMVRRGYIAMLAIDSEYRRKKIGSHLVLKAIKAMIADDCDEVVLETEITNKAALRLYENLGFVRDKRLFRYYLNGVDALRLKLWLR